MKMDEEKGKTFKILIVYDNPKNIQVLGNVLRNYGYMAGFATDGQQALDLLSETDEYDLILLDIDMPVMDGYETCKELRKNDRYKELPVIFLTAHTDIDSVVKGFQLGAQDYVHKPFKTEELLARVSTHLELKEKTEKLRLLNQMLELKVEERTRNLTEAYAKLSQLEKAKSDFILLISHELRTPLTGIRGYAYLLSQTSTSEEQKEFIISLLASSERLINFSETAIMVNQLKLKQYDIKKEDSPINNLIDIALTKFQNSTIEKKIDVKKIFTSENLSVLIDPHLFVRAIENVIDNAIKNSIEGGEIVISSRIEGNEVVISIADNGPGFPEEALAHLFELFTTSDIMHHSEGFGLGIVTARLIMDLHNGKMSIKNNTVGAEVKFYIPLIA
jgi:two-component system, sensor histidine kinase and response regulator